MTHARAVRVAVAAMRRELRVIAFDAAMHERYQATYPQAVSAARRQRELRAAIEELEKATQPRRTLGGVSPSPDGVT